MKNHIATALVLLTASSVSAQSVMSAEDAKLYQSTVGAVSTVEEFETYCSPLALLDKLQNNPRVLEKAGQWCENTREALKDAAFDQAMEELQLLSNYSSGCDESDNVRLSEERALALKTLEENKHVKLFIFWKRVYKHIYMCTDKIAKAQKLRPVVTLGDLERVK